MIRYVTGNLLNSDATVLVNTVNLVGASGAGLARQFRDRYPGLHAPYQEACRTGLLAPGQCWSWAAPDGKIVLCFPTKRHWRDKSLLADVEAGLIDLRQRLIRRPLAIAVPPLGCGLGGLRWADVRILIEAQLGDLKAAVLVYGPAAPNER